MHNVGAQSFFFGLQCLEEQLLSSASWAIAADLWLTSSSLMHNVGAQSFFCLQCLEEQLLSSASWARAADLWLTSSSLMHNVGAQSFFLPSMSWRTASVQCILSKGSRSVIDILLSYAQCWCSIFFFPSMSWRTASVQYVLSNGSRSVIDIWWEGKKILLEKDWHWEWIQKLKTQIIQSTAIYEFMR